jgi:hypothetical protein
MRTFFTCQHCGARNISPDECYYCLQGEHSHETIELQGTLPHPEYLCWKSTVPESRYLFLEEIGFRKATLSSPNMDRIHAYGFTPDFAEALDNVFWELQREDVFSARQRFYPDISPNQRVQYVYPPRWPDSYVCKHCGIQNMSAGKCHRCSQDPNQDQPATTLQPKQLQLTTTHKEWPLDSCYECGAKRINGAFPNGHRPSCPRFVDTSFKASTASQVIVGKPFPGPAGPQGDKAIVGPSKGPHGPQGDKGAVCFASGGMQFFFSNPPFPEPKLSTAWQCSHCHRFGFTATNAYHGSPKQCTCRIGTWNLLPLDKDPRHGCAENEACFLCVPCKGKIVYAPRTSFRTCTCGTPYEVQFANVATLENGVWQVTWQYREWD